MLGYLQNVLLRLFKKIYCKFFFFFFFFFLVFYLFLYFIRFIQYNHPITFIQYIRRGLSPSPHRLWLSGKDLPVVPQNLSVFLNLKTVLKIVKRYQKSANSNAKEDVNLCGTFQWLQNHTHI